MRPFVAIVLAASALTAQTNWLVDCSGRPGSQFTDIPPAVSAASPGDSIYVTNSYSSCTHFYTATVVDKPLRIIGVQEPGLAGLSRPSNVTGRFEIRNIPAGQEILLCNLSLAPGFAPNRYPLPHGFLLQNCAGKVHFERVDYTVPQVANGSVLIEDCADVSVHWSNWFEPGTAITVRRSNMTFHDCTIAPAPPITPYGGVWDPLFWLTITDNTFHLDGGSLRLTDCALFASASYGNLPDRLYAYVAGGTLLLGSNCWLPAYDAIENHGTTIIDPRATVGGFNPASNGIVRYERIGSVNMQPVIRNQPFRAAVSGPPNGFTILALGTSLHQPVPLPFGNLLLDPSDLVLAGCSALDPQGFHEFSFFVWTGAPMDHLYAFQAGTLSPTGVLELTWPSVFSVCWEGGHTWP